MAQLKCLCLARWRWRLFPLYPHSYSLYLGAVLWEIMLLYHQKIHKYIYIYWTQQQTVCLFDSCLIADFYWIFTVVRKCLKYFQFINSCRSLIAYLGSDSTTNLVKYMDMLFKITCIWLCPGDFTVDFRRL